MQEKPLLSYKFVLFFKTGYKLALFFDTIANLNMKQTKNPVLFLVTGYSDTYYYPGNK